MTWILMLLDVVHNISQILNNIADHPWLPSAIENWFRAQAEHFYKFLGVDPETGEPIYWDGSLAYGLYEFHKWYLEVIENLLDILDWASIKEKILAWVPDLEDVIDWWTEWWTWVDSRITTWWKATLADVKALIATAVEGLSDLLTAWDDFLTETLPGLLDMEALLAWWSGKLEDITGMFDTFLDEIKGNWEGWLDVKDDVAEFFSNPHQWVYNKLDEFFERYW